MIRLLLPICLLAGCQDQPRNAPATPPSGRANAEAAAPKPVPEVARVRLDTDAGVILLKLDGKRAPITTANFLAYVDGGRFDGTSFYRAAPTKGGDGTRGFIQGGIRRNYRLMLAPIAHEPTSRTGLRHEAGTISMARSEEGAGAMGDFFITASAIPSMDASADEPGYAAFGRVEEGLDVVRGILAAPKAEGGRGAMRGQMLAAPVRIRTATRVD